MAHPATYYHYEPLLQFKIHQIRNQSNATQIIQSLFKCDYSDLTEYLENAKEQKEAMSHNKRLWDHCYGRHRQLCYDPDFLSQYCSLFPFQSMKTVRLRLNLTKPILEDPCLHNVQILLLVRDPRGTLQSRKHRTWCPGHPDCDQAQVLCSDLVSDYHAAQQLTKDHPNRIKVIRYEDFCQDIKANAQSLLHFFGFTLHPQVTHFIDSHTHSNKGGVSSTFRDSKRAPYHWRDELTFKEVKDIQEKCTLAMKLWGYKKANTQKQLKKLKPLLNYTL